MIEIPEAIVLSTQIADTLVGKTIHQITADASHHAFAWYTDDPQTYPERFTGKTITGSLAYGGKLHILLSDNCGFMFCDGVSIRFIENEKKLPKKHQLLMDFGDGTYLVCTIRMYGSLMGYCGEFDNGYNEIAKIKPSVFSDAFDLKYLLSLTDGVDKEKTTLKAFLATEQRIPGLGNGVLHDILFLTGLHPKRMLSTLALKDYEVLLKNIKDTLQTMVDQGGRDVEKDLFGVAGGYKTLLSKNTYHYPCLKCGGPIIKQAYLGGSIYFCPNCQKL